MNNGEPLSTRRVCAAARAQVVSAHAGRAFHLADEASPEVMPDGCPHSSDGFGA